MKDAASSTTTGQRLIKVISNLCFSAFVFSVLIFTVVAITYQPPDPWLQSAPALTSLFTQTENATFKTDDSVLRTGEDLLAASSISPAISPISIPVTEVAIQAAEALLTNASLADAMSPEPSCELTDAVNCSDPRALFAIERLNLKIFKSISFFEYQTPVKGSKPDECDASWRFRNKKERSWRKYRDFRRFRFSVADDCSLKIVHAGGFHSGTNARRFRPKASSSSSSLSSQPEIFGDKEINDTIPIPTATNFRKAKYLYYSQGGDQCKGMNQYLWSFLCSLGEAMFLNRTLVMDLDLCLSSSSPNKTSDFRLYFDFEHLKEVAPVIEANEFRREWRKWDRTHKKNKVPVLKIPTHKVTPMSLKREKTTILWRQFHGESSSSSENYWYRVCEGPTAKHVQRPWHALWKSKRLMNIVTEIAAGMDWDFDAVHVVRGEKAANKGMWPNLERDTSPEAILEKVRGKVKQWRNLYVATNERFYNYFDKLRSEYKVHLLDDFKHLWGKGSEWANETTVLNGGNPVEFDEHMRVAVDTEVLYRAKTRLETFYDLTSDCKDGINTC